jgi:hypothetical protein
MPDRPGDVGTKPPAESAENAAQAPGRAARSLFRATPRGWVIVILAVAAWAAFVLIVLGVMSLFPD